MSKPPVIHQRGPKGKPACGYQRWSSQTLTTNGDQSRVTCKRRGCAVAKTQAIMPPVDRSETITVPMPSSVDILVYPSIEMGGCWVSQIIVLTPNSATGGEDYYGATQVHDTKPTKAKLAEQLVGMMTDEIYERLGLRPPATKDAEQKP